MEISWNLQQALKTEILYGHSIRPPRSPTNRKFIWKIRNIPMTPSKDELYMDTVYDMQDDLQRGTLYGYP